VKITPQGVIFAFTALSYKNLEKNKNSVAKYCEIG
jgi:hypothetical protein